MARKKVVSVDVVEVVVVVVSDGQRGGGQEGRPGG